MRKIIAITLAFTLLGSTIGITVQKHYCMSLHVATNLLPSVEDACGMKMPPGHNGCKDDHQQYRVDSPLVFSWFSFDASPSIEIIDLHHLQIAQLELADVNNDLDTKIFADNDPPPSEPDIFTRDQAFLL